MAKQREAIHHKYPIHVKSPERDCTKCVHATQIAPHEWECNAMVYDIKNLTCFVPREQMEPPKED